MNKGIAVIYDPHNVYQFLWYYATFGKNLEWASIFFEVENTAIIML